jgi:hypothetical protein
MKFKFEALNDFGLINGSSYFMDFGNMDSQEKAVIAEGRLLSAFGAPMCTSEDYEDSFLYVIRATSENGEDVILSVYGVGVVHIGATQQDEFAKSAATALVEYVNSFEPTDFSRTLYYMDFNLQIEIELNEGEVTVNHTELSEEEAEEIYSRLF